MSVFYADIYPLVLFVKTIRHSKTVPTQAANTSSGSSMPAMPPVPIDVISHGASSVHPFLHFVNFLTPNKIFK